MRAFDKRATGILLAASLGACASRSAVIHGATEGGALRRAGASVCVLVDPATGSAVLNRDVAATLLALLEQKGYRGAESQDADYYVFFGFGTDLLYEQSPQSVGLKHRFYNHRVTIRLVDAPLMRSEGRLRVVWAGEIVADTAARDPDQVEELLTLLVTALCRRVGEDVDERVRLR